MKTKKSMRILFIGASMFFSSCATLLTGMKQKVTFKSNVEGKVYQNLTPIGKTNEEIKIYRSAIPKLYTIKADGCHDEQFELPIKANPAVFLNILNGMFIGGYFDLAFGSNMRTDKIINVDVDCKGKGKSKSKSKKVVHTSEDDE